MSPDAAERLVAGRWTLHSALRRGPAGMIWRATDTDGRSLAVEELRFPTRPDPDGPDQAVLWDRVAAEARTAASLDHPGLVRLEDVVVEDGVVYVASELVDALTLDELTARHGPLPVRRAAQLGLELLDALEAAHAAGLPHLDLRPGNVLVTTDGHVRLAGLGLAALRTATGAGLGTTPGADRATAAFLAPEQVRGDQTGPAADLWALGTILFLAVEGEPPFGADGNDATRAAILSDHPRPPDRAGPLAPTLTALLTKPAGGRPTIADTRRLLEAFVGRSHPGEEEGKGPATPQSEGPAHPQPAVPDAEGTLAGWWQPTPGGEHPSPGWGQAVVPGTGQPPVPPVVPGAGQPPLPVPGPPMVPGTGQPPLPVPGPPEGEPSAWGNLAPFGVHSLLDGPRAAWHAMDPVARQVLLIAGGSLLLALVSFVVVVAVNGDPLGLRERAVASTITTVPPTTLPPTTTAPSPTPTTSVALVPPGWAVHTDPGTGYQIAVPPGWQVVADGGPHTELRDQSSPTVLRIDWQQDPQADPVTLEQQASQAHAGQLGGYQQARLEPTQFKGLPAALLEFTYQDGETWHVLELGVRSPRHHVAMAIYSRDRDWGAGWALFEAFKGSFVPPST
jgi:eukaryotic-like serine/threonine-protein kinase